MELAFGVSGTTSYWDPGAEHPECQLCGTYDLDDQTLDDIEEQANDAEPSPIDLLCAECRTDTQDTP